MKKKNFYEILGVPVGASQLQINEAFARISKHTHHGQPVKQNIADNKANSLAYGQAAGAYQVLRHPQNRKNYDDFHQLNQDPKPASDKWQSNASAPERDQTFDDDLRRDLFGIFRRRGFTP